MNLRGIYHRFIAGDDVHKKANSYSKTDQKEFAKSLKSPIDDYDRSYAKYMSRKFMDFGNGNAKWILLNTASFLLFIPVLIIYIINSVKTIQNKQTADTIIIRNSSFKNIDDILPIEALKNYQSYIIVTACGNLNGIITKRGRKILKNNIFKHPFCFYLNFILLLNIGKYEELIKKYQPLAIFSYANERTPVIPLVTLLCEQMNIKHIGFMHGECYYQLDKGFFRYSDYWVWDDFYLNLFKEMYCNCPMHIYLPKKFNVEHNSNGDPSTYLTYYDAENSEESLKRISEIFNDLNAEGKKCVIRPHPRFSNMSMIKQLFSSDMIQDGRQVDIFQSFDETLYVAAICSTVLMEAYYSGKSVVIDDITDPVRLDQIADKGYIMLEKEHLKLSSIITDACEAK